MTLRDMSTAVAVWLAMISLAVSSSSGEPPSLRLMPFEQVAAGPWQVRRWAVRPFVFLSYGNWSKGNQLAARECRFQRLLTPTWDDPAFPHPVESSATEWGWSLRPEGKTRRECYEWVKKVYLEKITKRAHSQVPLKKGERFYSLTGHSWFSVYGAQWGCDMVGLETGENIIAMQGQIAFLRGAARQNGKPFYVQPSQWYGGTVPLFREGEDEFTPHALDEAKVREGISRGGIAIPNGGHSPSLLARMWYVAWLSQYLGAGGRLFLTHAQAEQLGPRLDGLRKAGSVEFFGLDKEHMPQQVETSRWYTPAHWGADAATLAARKKAVELLPYEQYFKGEVQRILPGLAAQYFPVRVSGQGQFLLSRTRQGWIVGLVNNQGVTKENMRPVQVDPSLKQTVSVCLQEGQVLQAFEWCSAARLPIQGTSVAIDVPPGEVRIVELTVNDP